MYYIIFTEPLPLPPHLKKWLKLHFNPWSIKLNDFFVLKEKEKT